jgi:ribonuclease HI
MNEEGIVIARVDGGYLGCQIYDGPQGRRKLCAASFAAIGVVIEYPNGEKIRISEYIGSADNNAAEYLALLAALNYAGGDGIEHLCVKSDSEVVVRQMSGQYKCRNAQLRELYDRCQKASRRIARVRIEKVSREEVLEAGHLAQRQLQGRTHRRGG